MHYSNIHSANNIFSTIYRLREGLLVFALFLFYNLANAQSIDSSHEKTVNELISKAPITYAEIDEVFKWGRSDTLLMRYFANRALEENYLDGQSYALNQLGRKYRNTSQFSKALTLHQGALEAAEQAKNIEFRVYSLNMLGVVFRKTDGIKSALEYYQKALELAESVKEPSIGIKRSINVSRNGIGNLYQTLEQYDLAIDKFNESIKIDEELNNALGLAVNHQNIGDCYEAQGELEKAFQSFMKSLAYNDEINSDYGRVICKNSLAHVYVHQGMVERAIDTLQTILKTANTLGDKQIISSIHINLGWALSNANKYNQAKRQLFRGLKIANDYNILSSISEANKFLSDLAVKQGHFEDALSYYKVSKHYDDEISNDRNLRYVNDMIMRYETEKRSNELKQLAKENELVKMELVKNRTRLLVSGIAIALLAGILYILYRQYQLKNEKKMLTLEQSMLRSQMNPHFLFNSLNSIKLYIINNEQKNAVHYLNKFSKLVRKILEASSLKEIPLADELETVELYMNIENIRFSNEINFTIHMAEGIDPHTVKIPSLILQPFLENALWHGLSSKDGPKNIDLEVSEGKEDGFIHIGIIDNGIGREAAEKIKLSKVLKRKSVGIDITKERLSNFSRDYLNSFNLEIIDLFKNGVASGTKVLLHIPTL